MKKYIGVFMLIFLLLTIVGIIFAQIDSTTVTPEQGNQMQMMAFWANFICSLIMTPIITYLKKIIPFITGPVTILITSLIGLAVVYFFQGVIGWSVWTEPNFWKNVMVALGINQTVAAGFFELLKLKKKVQII